MKRYIFFFLLLFSSGLLSAQDILFFKDGRWIEAKVLEVQPEIVKYKKYGFQDGPLYSVYKREIRKIQYENGQIDWFIPEEERPAPPPPDAAPVWEKEAPPATEPPPYQPPSTEPKAKKEPPPPAPALPPATEEAFQPKLLIGITAGINAATGIYDYRGAAEPPAYSILPAPTVGASLDWRISPRFSMQSGLYYRGKGDRIDMGEWMSSIEVPFDDAIFAPSYTETEGHIQTYVGYLEWPLYPVLNLSAGFQIGIGPYMAIGLHGTEKPDYKSSYFVDGLRLSSEEVKGSRKVQFTDVVALEDDADTRHFNRLDYGLTGYLGVRARKMTVGWTVSYGLAQWEPEWKFLSTQQAPTETHHLTGAMLLTYYFEL